MKEKNNEKSLDSLAAQVDSTISSSQKKDTETSKWDSLPPLHLWNPDLSGEMDLTITKEGQWVYQGNPIKREKVIKLFSRIIKKEGNEYFLVTPVEKWKISVEDTPWIIVDVEVISGPDNEIHSIVFETNIGDKVELSEVHKLFVVNRTEGDVPYVYIRNDLHARLNRQTYYKLCDYAQENEEGKFVLKTSKGIHPLQADEN